jgi:lipoprotein-anchoring transpeptidase ErfK/SrfK
MDRNLDEAGLQAEHQRLLQAVQQRQSETPYIVINTQDNLLVLRNEREIVHRAVCATGSGRKLEGPKRWKHRWVFDTPKGRFSVLRKVEDPLWTKPEWVFVEASEEIPIFAEDLRRFQRGVLGKYALYFARDYMIHATLYGINLGKSITHGCVRVGEEDLRYFYERVQPGWPVYIY